MTGGIVEPAQIESAQVVLPCQELDETLTFFTDRLGFLVETIMPADDPSVAVLAGHGDVGRAGMRYRDLIPGRQGGRFIASHIHIEGGGPVPDYVHYHRIRFQMIYCRRGWARLVYEDQGEPFLLEAGDCVRHRAADAAWEPWRMPGFETRAFGFDEATGGLAEGRVVRPVAADGTASTVHHEAEFVMLMVLDGRLVLDVEGHGALDLGGGDTVVVPSGVGYTCAASTPDL